MTQEEKQLLLTDLCARLLYKPVCHAGKINHDGNLYFINIIYSTVAITSDKAVGKFETCPIVDVKPYLRPMSSMTEEENTIFNNISNKGKGYEEDENGWVRCDSIHTKWGVWPDGCAKLLDYLDSIHVDYRGLIQMGLALEAPEGMYKTE